MAERSPVAEPGVIAALREAWRRIDRLERVARHQQQLTCAEQRHGDSNFLLGQASGARMAKEVVEQIARQIGAKANVPSAERAITHVTNANER